MVTEAKGDRLPRHDTQAVCLSFKHLQSDIVEADTNMWKQTAAQVPVKYSKTAELAESFTSALI